MLMVVIVLVGVRIAVSIFLLGSQIGRSRRVLLSIHNYIDFDGADADAVHPRNFQTCSDAEGLDRLLKNSGRNSGVDQRAEKHIATNSGEAV